MSTPIALQNQAGGPPGFSSHQTASTQVTVVRTAGGAQPNDYFNLALVVTLCCCLPLGIVGIIKSMEVRSKWAAGDAAGAESASMAAKKWTLAGLVCGIIINVIVIIIVIIYYATVGASVYSTYYDK